MGSIVSGITGKGGGTSLDQLQGQYSQYGQNQAALANQVTGLLPETSNITNLFANVGGDVMGGGIDQYTRGAAGVLSPAQQALTDFTLGQNNARTNATFGGLGLGGSTMANQALGGNQLASLTQQESIDLANQAMGIQGMQMGTSMENAALGGLLDQANMMNTAGNLYGEAAGNTLQQANPLLQSKSGLGGSLGQLSSLFGGGSGGSGSGGGGLLGSIGSLFGSGGSAAGSGMGNALSSAAASSPFDIMSAMAPDMTAASSAGDILSQVGKAASDVAMAA